MLLPAIDFGLMAEHLSTHDGVISKLKRYELTATNPTLKEIIQLQISVMESHVRTMLMLINPQQNGEAELSPLHSYPLHQIAEDTISQVEGSEDKWIAIEAHNTSMTMANTNFNSALMMKQPNVRSIHFNMALQQVALKEKYDKLLNQKGWTFVPDASSEEQLRTYQHFQYLL